jgi:hypothetical protein
MVRNLSECFLGTKPMGETWKLGKGGSGNVPATRPSDTSLGWRLQYVVELKL